MAASYVHHARLVAAELARLPGAVVQPQPPHTHQFRLFMGFPAEVLNEAGLALAAAQRVWFAGGWVDVAGTGLAVTEMTVAGPALELSAADVARIGEAFLAQVHRIGTYVSDSPR